MFIWTPNYPGKLQNNELFQKLDAQPIKKTRESKKCYPHLSLGIPQNKHFLVARVKKTWEFPKLFIVF